MGRAVAADQAAASEREQHGRFWMATSWISWS
jgi:hypothetical protein